MAKKTSAKLAAKTATKKIVKKGAASQAKAVKKAVSQILISEQASAVSSVSDPATQVSITSAEVTTTQEPTKSISAESISQSHDSSSTVVEESMPAVQAQTEENDMGDDDMGDESKGVGKKYNASEFSQPATEAGTSSPKVYLYVGISVAVLAVIVGGLFFLGGFEGKTTDSELTGSTITAYCSDTDGGYNRFNKGVAQGIYYLNYSSGNFMDFCEETDANKLTEYYCKNDLVVYTTEPCPDGLKCADGICA